MKSALALLLVVGLGYASALSLSLNAQEAGNVFFTNTAGPANAQWTVTVDRNPPTSVVVCVSWLTPLDDPPVADLTSVWKKTCPRASSAFLECNTTESCVLTVSPQLGEIYVNVLNTGVTTTAVVTQTAESCNCGTPKVLKPGAPVSVSSQQRANYIASVSSAKKYLESASFNFTGGDGTAYFALASYPTEDIYDFKCNFGTTDNTDCVLANPAFNSVANGNHNYGWIILVDSQDDITVAVNESFGGPTSARLLNVSDAGEYYIPNDVDLHQVFYIDNVSPETETLDIIVAGLDGYEQLDVAPDVWVQLDSFPSSERFLVAASGAQANRISIDIVGIATAESVWYLEIDNTRDIYAYGIWTPSNDTYLCPGEPLCGGSAHGTCDELTYVCNCTKSYDGLACDHEIKNFETEYIILIAVGGLLVLSIVIGVPIYCWMNMRKDYEMVD